MRDGLLAETARPRAAAHDELQTSIRKDAPGPGLARVTP